MGKLIRKRTFIGNIALVIFLAFLCTVTFGTVTYAVPVAPTQGTFTDQTSTSAPVKVMDNTGSWQGDSQTANLQTFDTNKKVRFTIQVLTDNFNSIWLEIPGLLDKTRASAMDSSVVSATYKSVYGTAYSVYQIIYTFVYGPGFTTAGDNNGVLRVYTSDTSYKSIILDLEEPVPITSPTVEVNPAAPNVAVTSTTPAATITVPSTVTNATVNVAQMLNAPAAGTVTTNALPALDIQVDVPSVSATNPVTVSIPAGTTITAPAGWTGTIEVPKTVAPPAIPGGTATSAIEIGFGDIPLTFSLPVKIVIPGKAGQNIKWIRGNDSGIIQTISACTTPAQAAAALGALNEGKHDYGSDLVVWTKHFTQFVTYTVSSGGGGSGGGSGGVAPSYQTSTTGSAKVYPGAGGSISLGSDATVKIPANALKGTSQVEVKVQKVTSPAAAPAGYKLVSGVYDFTVGDSHTYTFNKKVTVTLKFDPKLLAVGQTPAIFNLKDGSTTWTKIGGSVSGSTITADVDHFSQFAVMVEDKAVEPPIPGGLTDIKGHWAQAVIAELVEKGAIAGYPDKTFKPERTMTRTEFVVVLTKAFGMRADASYALKFKDNSKIPAWGKAYIAAAVKAGIVKGDDLGNFNPGANVTRAEMAVMVAKAKNARLSTAPKLTFKDKVPTWAAGAVEYLVKADVLTGYPDNTFKAGNNATRAEACTVISKAGKL